MPVFVPRPSSKVLRELDCAIDSVLDQCYPGEMELLIVDDGSPTPVDDLIARSRATRPSCLRIVRTHRNNGLVHALNLGLRTARYDLIARIDADDAWLPDKIERQVERFAVDADLSIVGTGMSLVFEDGRLPETHIRADGWGAALRFFHEIGCPFPHGSIIARKDIYHLLGGYPHSPDVIHCEDYALWSIWIRFFKPGMIEQQLYNYSVSASSMSGQNVDWQLQASGKIQNGFRKLDIVDILPIAMEELSRVLNITLLQAGVLSYRLWHYDPSVLVPEAALAPLRKILPDRHVQSGTWAHRPAGMDLSDLLQGFCSGRHQRPRWRKT
jgi:glycosyltransferase involved in cell wall biosynthesis